MDANQDKYVALLKEAVAIKSVSAWPECRPEIRRMINWTKEVQCSLPIITSQNVGLLYLEWSLFSGVFDTVIEASVSEPLVVIGRWLLFGRMLVGESTV